MKRLVVVSNRVGPLDDEGQAGGLAVGIADALRSRGGIWFGWSGEVTPAGTFGELHEAHHDKVTMATVDFTEEDVETFYSGFSNSALWPVLHYRVDLASFEHAHRRGYARVNWRMAARLIPLLKPGDAVWVHDYHYIPLGERLREGGFDGPLAFFLHVPLPPPELMMAIPDADQLLGSLLAYDLIGFQTETDRQNFCRFAVSRLDAVELPDGRLSAGNRMVRTKAFAIGIDADRFARFATSEEAQRNLSALENLPGKMVVGVDRLDYSKGIPERLAAFERLLRDYPENRGQTSLVQISPLSRADLEAYDELRRGLEETAGHINGTFGHLDWTPVRIITRGFTRAGLAGIYRASRVGLVTPLRDGMNLVAKEYIAAQDPADPGVLVLSQFAGAAAELKDAVIVNPLDTEALADALQQALTMPLAKRKARHANLLRQVRTVTAESWCRSVLAALDNVGRSSRPAEEGVELPPRARPAGLARA